MTAESTLRRFIILYPESGTLDMQEVWVNQGETPEQAIQREGNPLEEWEYVSEEELV